MTKKQPVPTEPAEVPRVVSFSSSVSAAGVLTLANLLDLTFEALNRGFPDESVVSGHFGPSAYISILAPAERREFT